MKNVSESRRNFMKKLLTASVVTAVCPHFVLGKSEPEVVYDDNKIIIKHQINVNDYQALAEVWGSVRIDVKDPDNKTFRLVITKVPYNIYKKYYAVVGEVCPHQGKVIGNPVKGNGLMRCDQGHGSIFDVEGNYMSGPAAGQNLNQYKSSFNPDTSILEIQLEFIVGIVNDDYSYLGFLDNVYPSPCSDTALIKFGNEKAGRVTIDLLDSQGHHIAGIYDEYTVQQIHSISYNVSSLPSGAYFVSMAFDGVRLYAKKLVVRK